MTRRCVVGFLSDITSGERMPHYERIGRMAFDLARETGVVDVEVDLELREVEGLPKGDGELVTDAYRDLERAGAVAVIGPFVTDNCTYLKPTVEEVGVPCVAWCGASSWLGPSTFSLPNGSLLDEGPLLALHVHRQGWRRVAVIRDDSEIGETYWRYFERAARRLGLEVVSCQAVDRLADDLAAELRQARRDDPDVLVYLGYGMSLQGINPHLDGWTVPKLATTAFIFCYRPQYLPGFEGWSGLDQLDPANPMRQSFLRLCRERLGYEPDFMTATLMFDSARAIAEALALAPTLTPAGVRDGLEGVRLLPAASGAAGTTISLGPYAHKGFEGTGYLVLGRVRNGTPEFECYIEPEQSVTTEPVASAQGTAR